MPSTQMPCRKQEAKTSSRSHDVFLSDEGAGWFAIEQRPGGGSGMAGDPFGVPHRNR